MALLALSYPVISQTHWTWIQAIRKQHDPQYALVAPHFTLVFPTFECERGAFCRHIRHQVKAQPAIAISLRCALVVKDAFSDLTHAFLVPDQGFGDLVKLHDNLYRGFLADLLRLDIPFIPHITVAASLDATVCKRLADEINSQPLAIEGWLRAVDIVEHANGTVTTLEQIALA